MSGDRAAGMFLIGILAEPAGRTYDLLTGMAAAALLLLWKNPLYLNDSGFLLSFGAVFAIGAVLPVMEKLLTGPDNRKEKQKEKWKQRWKQSLLASFSVFLVTLPVILKSYFSYPLYGVFLNLLIIPLMSVLFPMAFFMGVIGVFFPPAALVLSFPVAVILRFYESVCLFVEKIPGAIQLAGCPSMMKIVVYYVIFSILLAWGKWGKTEKYGYFSKAAAFLTVCMMVLLLYRLPGADLKVHFLDIGQGDSIVMELPGGGVVTVDGGSSDISLAGKYRLKPFLKAGGKNRIAYAFLTHMDADHISAVQELLEMEEKGSSEIFIENIAVPGILKEKEKWKELKALAEQKGTRILYVNAGDVFKIKGVRLQCLHPSGDFVSDSENAASLVLKVTYGMFDLLLTGDVEGEGEKKMAEACGKELGDVDILKVAHHGSKGSTSEEFLKVCPAKYAVISCGEKNRYGHPHEELLARLSGKIIFQTKDSGQITVETDGKKMKWREYRAAALMFHSYCGSPGDGNISVHPDK